MAERTIEWTQRAAQDQLKILKYWNINNQSSTYSKKLQKLFAAATQQLVTFPFLGKRSDYKKIRIITIKD